LQLQNAIATQRELDTVSGMLAARVDAGRAARPDQLELEARLAEARDRVAGAVNGWNLSGQRFTRLTRLLPVQLEAVVDNGGHISADEMDSLAAACLWIRADVHLSLGERVRTWADRHAGSSGNGGVQPEDFNSWILRMEQSRAQASADFACAREAYLQAALDFDREHACFVRARSLRRTAESSFRLGARSAHDFAHAILVESEHMHAVLSLQSRRLLAVHRLHALAGVYPALFGGVEAG
jgi:hypothetical protein